MESEIIQRYFPGELTARQTEQFEALGQLYREWNARINVISRKDIDELYTRHILHSLAIARVCRFAPGASVCDVGCGGGFPSIPLAIMFPDTVFTAVDSIAKKIRVVEQVSAGAGITNIRPLRGRIEETGGNFDYIVCRAVTNMSDLLRLISGRIRKGKAGTLENGLICLKGGELAEELGRTGRKFDIFDIHNFFPEEFFETKKVVYTPIVRP